MKKIIRSLGLAALAGTILLASPLHSLAATDYVGKENQGADLKISFLSRYDSGVQDGEGGDRRNRNLQPPS